MTLSKTFVLIAGLLLLLGCSRPASKNEDFTPSGDKARQAMEAALNHWQGGGQPGTVPNTSPVVNVTDSKWQAGQKLKYYEITGDEPPSGPGPRFFKVRLTIPSGATVETKYAVFGIDPLQVFREEDYQKLSGVGK